VLSVTQEHGVVGSAAGAEQDVQASGSARSVLDGRLAVGEKVRILANHSCLSAALFDEYCVVRGEDVVDRWRIHRAR
jgi:D-serine deaminase-like pyridoxal phosphate-dependent protein